MAGHVRPNLTTGGATTGRIMAGQVQTQLQPKPIQQRLDNSMEYKLRVPKNLVKRYSVMKLKTPRPIKLDDVKEVYMSRKTGHADEEEAVKNPMYGAGSEYGKERREEAKKRKRGQVPKHVNPEDLPFTLQVGGKHGKCYTGKKEGAILDNASYYVLTQCADRVFEAIPVQAWYTFTPDINYQTLSADEAEHEFTKRDKTINYYNLMLKKRLETLEQKDDSEDAEKKDKVTSKAGFGLMIHDDEEDEDEDDFEEVSDNDEDTKKGKKNKGKPKKGKNMYSGRNKKAKKKDSDAEENSDEEEELENIESKEFDYLSESSSDDEAPALEDEPEPDQTNAKFKAKDDISAIVLTDSSDEEEETNDLTDVGKELKELIKKQKKDDESSSDEDDDDDDEDIDNSDKYQKSSLFIQGKDKKKKGKSGSNSGSASSSRSCTPTQQLDGSGNQSISSSKRGKIADQKKRPNSRGPTDSMTPPSKKQKSTLSNNDANYSPRIKGSDLALAGTDGNGGQPSKRLKSSPDTPSMSSESRTPTPSGELTITEEAIIRYLTHKPMTTTDLVRKFKTKKTGLSKEDTVKTIATILEKISPDREMVDGKLYLSIKQKK